MTEQPAQSRPVPWVCLRLTDEWDRAGVKQGQEYATLTDIITREWSGKTTRQYKQLTSFSSFEPRPFKRA